MASLPQITETEGEIMKVLWRESPLTSQEVFERLSEKEEWHPNTVRSLMNRLANKGALATERYGRAYLYRPIVKESDYLTERTEKFLSSVFDGSLEPMVKHLIRQEKLSKREIEQLKRILEGRG